MLKKKINFMEKNYKMCYTDKNGKEYTFWNMFTQCGRSMTLCSAVYDFIDGEPLKSFLKKREINIKLIPQTHRIIFIKNANWFDGTKNSEYKMFLVPLSLNDNKIEKFISETNNELNPILRTFIVPKPDDAKFNIEDFGKVFEMNNYYSYCNKIGISIIKMDYEKWKNKYEKEYNDGYIFSYPISSIPILAETAVRDKLYLEYALCKIDEEELLFEVF